MKTPVVEENALGDLLEAIRWRWPVILLVALSVTAGASYYVESLPAQYETEALVALAPRTEEGASADTVRLIAPKYVEYVVAPSTVTQLAADLNMDPNVLEDAVDASVATDTGNLSISAELTDPELAAAVANEFARQVTRFALQDRLVIAELVAEAIPADSPSGPPRRLLEAASLGVGLLLGIAVSVLLERGRPRLHSVRDIARITGHPVVGRIPRARIVRSRLTDAFTDPVIGAAFRTLRANLEREWHDRTVDTIIVTSSATREGKTTVSVLFAESLARLGAQVLLIDGDLRKPRLADLSDGETNDGLAGVLRGTTDLTATIRPGWIDNLHILATVSDTDAGDLIARGFLNVLNEARAKFDVVIVDSPPVIGTDDTRTLAVLGHGVLFVVARDADVHQVNEAIMALESLRAPILGIVGNRLRESTKSYGYF